MDAERIVTDYLNSGLADAKAYYGVPARRPKRFVTVVQTGGPRGELVVERPLIDAKCWASTRADASALADEVEALLLAMPDALDDCFGVSVSSRYRDTDLESGTPRYHLIFQATFNE